MELIKLFTIDHGNFARSLQIEVVLLSLFVLLFVTNFLNNITQSIIIIVFIYFIIIHYINIKKTSVIDNNKILMFRLKSIQEVTNRIVISKINLLTTNQTTQLPKKIVNQMLKDAKLHFLYKDTDLINFIFSISSLSKWNEPEFYLFVTGINNILKVKNEIEELYNSNKTFPINISEMFETAQLLKTNTLNNLHNFIYTIPKQSAMRDFINISINRYHVLISRNLDIIYSYYKKSIKDTPLTNETRFVSYNTTKPFDPILNHKMNTQEPPKLIGFFV